EAWSATARLVRVSTMGCVRDRRQYSQVQERTHVDTAAPIVQSCQKLRSGGRRGSPSVYLFSARFCLPPTPPPADFAGIRIIPISEQFACGYLTGAFTSGIFVIENTSTNGACGSRGYRDDGVRNLRRAAAAGAPGALRFARIRRQGVTRRPAQPAG